MLREVRGPATSVQLPVRFRWFHQQSDLLLFFPFPPDAPSASLLSPATLLPTHYINWCTAPLLLFNSFFTRCHCLHTLQNAPLNTTLLLTPGEFIPCFLICCFSFSLSPSLLILPQYNYLMVQCFSEPLHTCHLSLHLQQLCIKVHAA